MFFNTTSTKSDDQIVAESFSLISQAMILEHTSAEELEAFLSDGTELAHLENEEIVQERTIVKLDKKAKISQAQKMAVFTIAKERNDPKFKKLMTVWRLERTLEAELFRKYGNEGLRRAKKVVEKNRKSKSGLLKTVAKKTETQFNKAVV